LQNRFAAPMSKRTDKELIKIVTVDRNSYEPLAVEAAEGEITKRNLDFNFIEETSVYLANEFEKESAIKNSQVGQASRLLHLVVDTFVHYSITILLYILAIQFFPSYSRDVDFIQFMAIFLFFVAFFGYYTLMEYLFQKTVGKFLTKTKVVTKEGEKPGFSHIFIRTVLRLVPFDNVTFMTGTNGFHDVYSKTMVVKDLNKI
jgi:hypothetical protein